MNDSSSEHPATQFWSVWRQDDNGNRFEMSREHTRDQAEAIAKEFERRGHKQLYWVEPQR